MQPTQKNPIGLNVAVLRALAKHVAAQDDPRHYLNAVHVGPHPDGILYEATDGSCAVRWLDITGDLFEEGKPESPIILSAEDLSRLATPEKGHPVGQPSFQLDEENWRVGGVVARRIDGDYPDFSKVFHQTPTREEGQFNFDYFARLYKFVAEATRRPRAEVSLHVCHNGKSGGALVSSSGVENFIAVVMPRETVPEHDACPEWALHSWPTAEAEPL